MKAQWLGLLDYPSALDRQRSRRRRVIDGEAPGVLWLLEHPPVVTLGRRGGEASAAAAAGLDVVQVERGGLATYHGPGQLVGYLICDLSVYGLKVREVVSGIEQGIIAWLEPRGVDAARRCDAPGVWVGGSKICAVGLHFRKGVSMHGFALNLRVDLAPFDLIVPCGLSEGGVTSLLELTGSAPAPQDASASVGLEVLRSLGLDAQQGEGYPRRH